MIMRRNRILKIVRIMDKAKPYEVRWTNDNHLYYEYDTMRKAMKDYKKLSEINGIKVRG